MEPAETKIVFTAYLTVTKKAMKPLLASTST